LRIDGIYVPRAAIRAWGSVPAATRRQELRSLVMRLASGVLDSNPTGDTWAEREGERA
jgi:hypothetical protein